MKKALVIAITAAILYILGYNAATNAVRGLSQTHSQGVTLCVAVSDGVYKWDGRTITGTLPDSCLGSGFKVKERNDDVYPDENYKGMGVDVGCTIYCTEDYRYVYVEVTKGKYYRFVFRDPLMYLEGDGNDYYG